jgi:hypothetical protein
MATQPTIEFPGMPGWSFARRIMPQDNIQFIPKTFREGNNIITLQTGTKGEKILL